MTVSTTVGRWQYDTNGTTGPWTVGAYFIADEDLNVTYTDAAGVDSLLVLNVDYTVTGAGAPSGGTITTSTAYAAGGKITIVDDPEALQETDYSETDAFPAATHEQALDRLTLIVQRLRLLVERALRISDSEDALAVLPSAQDRALKTLTFDADGNPVCTTPAAGTAEALAADLMDDGQATNGSGMVGFNRTLNYVAGTVGAVLYEVNVKAFPWSAKGDWDGSSGTDDHAAITAAYDWLVAKIISDGYVAGGRLVIPSGAYRLTQALDFYRPNSPRIDIVIQGEDQFTSEIICDFYGADEAVIKSVDPGGTTRSSPISIRDVGFSHKDSNGVNPVFIDVLGWGESRLERVRFGATNNTVMRAISMQNVRMIDVVSFNGGRHFNYKDTSGLTFSVNGGTKTITASGSIFTADDDDLYFVMLPANGTRRIRYRLTYVSATTATFTEDGLTETAESAIFEPARCSISSGSSTLVANADVFTSDMVGMVLAIRGAEAGAYGDAVLRARIISYSAPDTVILDRTAGVTVTQQMFGVPAFDFGKQTGFAGSSDVMIWGLHIESYRGLALLMQNTDSYHVMGKLHGEVTPTTTAASLAAAWLDDCGGKFDFFLDSSCSMSSSRIHFSNLNESVYMRTLITRGLINQPPLSSSLFTDAGGYVFVEGMSSTEDFSDPYDMVVDDNYNTDPTDPRLLLTGNVNMLGDAQSPRFYVGRETYFTPLGVYKPQHRIDDTALSATVTWNSTPPSGTESKRYRWERVGSLVHFQIRLEYSVAGTTNSLVTIALPADMPAPDPFTGSGASEVMGALVQGFIGTAPGSAPEASKAWMADNGAGGYNFNVALGSGTISARVAVISGSYWTEE